MTLTYPIAANGEEALTAPKGLARTKSGARREIGQAVEFETEWLRPNPQQAEDWQAAVLTAVSYGAAQVYEAEKGGSIIAISFWKLVEEPAPVPARPKAGESKEPRNDHADDLYFRRGRTRQNRKPAVDPNQMDLFGGSSSDD